MPRRRIASVLGVLAVLALTLAACGADKDNDSRAATAGLPNLQQSLEAETWLLDGLASRPQLTSGAQVTMHFTDQRLAGDGPCNAYSAGYSLDGDSITITAPVSTRRACVDAAANADEAAFLRALEKATKVNLDDDRSGFTLTGDGVELVFGTYDQAAALKDKWNITKIAVGDAIRRSVSGTDPTITFTAKQVKATTGCNDIATSYTLRGDAISFAPAARTMMACEKPQGVMAQEQGIADALDHAATVSVTPTTLTLLNSDGHILLVATRGG